MTLNDQDPYSCMGVCDDNSCKSIDYDPNVSFQSHTLMAWLIGWLTGMLPE